jgi:hypothetical protein
VRATLVLGVKAFTPLQSAPAQESVVSLLDVLLLVLDQVGVPDNFWVQLPLVPVRGFVANLQAQLQWAAVQDFQDRAQVQWPSVFAPHTEGRMQTPSLLDLILV